MQIAIVGSGSGSNAAAICAHFSEVEAHDVALVLSNKKGAGILEKAQAAGVPSMLIEREHIDDGDYWLRVLDGYEIDLIALAGYIRKVPKAVVAAYSGRMLNTHPALLPKHGGQGMYGINVHRAVLLAQERESGMTIHLVTEEYDEGEVVFQQKIEVQPNWTAEQLQEEIKALEHTHYPRVIEEFCERLSRKRP